MQSFDILSDFNSGNQRHNIITRKNVYFYTAFHIRDQGVPGEIADISV